MNQIKKIGDRVADSSSTSTTCMPTWEKYDCQLKIVNNCADHSEQKDLELERLCDMEYSLGLSAVKSAKSDWKGKYSVVFDRVPQYFSSREEAFNYSCDKQSELYMSKINRHYSGYIFDLGGTDSDLLMMDSAVTDKEKENKIEKEMKTISLKQLKSHQYSMDELANNIDNLDLMDVLIYQRSLSALFCVKHILMNKYKTKEEEFILAGDIVQYQPHLSVSELLNLQKEQTGNDDTLISTDTIQWSRPSILL